MGAEAVIVGAGIAGLACARALTRDGARVVVLEKSRGVGGRCATRRVDGRPVDHGLSFLHGTDKSFLDAIRLAAGPGLLEGWPVRVEGNGRPCQPEAFREDETRLAIEQGLTAFPKWLARGLDVRLGDRVVSLDPRGDEIVVHATSGVFPARTVLLAMPAPQAATLLASLESRPRAELDAVRGMLAMLGSVACLTVIATYRASPEEPEWDMLYPEESAVLQSVSRDTSKRAAPGATVLVLQGGPSWSRRRLGDPVEAWTAEILEEAGGTIGDWAAHPERVQSHVWRFARADLGSELSGPILVELAGGSRLGLAGEVFAPGGGVQAAWRSGTALANRVLEGR